MARTRQQKEEAVKAVTEILRKSKMTVFARYSGTSVKDLQELRTNAKNSNTEVKIIKNRLFIRALRDLEELKNVDPPKLSGQLLYAFHEDDEVAPAQVLATFARSHAQIEFVGALTNEGDVLNDADVKELAALPGKDQLRANLVALVSAPASQLAGVLSANVRGLLTVMQARSESLSTS